MDELLKKLDVILDKYGVMGDREAIKDEIYWEVIHEAYNLSYEDGNDPKSLRDI